MRQGEPLDLQLVGGEALNALRVEKGFLHWGHDMSYTEAPHQVGLGFVCKPDKAIPIYWARRLCQAQGRGQRPILVSHQVARCPPLVAPQRTRAEERKSRRLRCQRLPMLMHRARPSGLVLSTRMIGTTITEGAFAVMVEGQAIPATVSLKPFS